MLLCLATQTGHTVLHATQNLLQSSSATSTVAPPVSSASTLIAAATKTPIGDKCGSGRYGIVVSSETTGDEVQICPMCPAGTTGNGDGCTACAAGSASSSVGASSCSTSCTAGTYAQAGEASLCDPTWQALGRSVYCSVDQLQLSPISAPMLQAALPACPAPLAPTRMEHLKPSARSGEWCSLPA